MDRSRVEIIVGVGKDVVVFSRDATLLLLLGLLLLFPVRLNDLLVSAGFEEGSFVGFKWKAKLVQADDALQEARAIIADLEAQLERTTKALGEAAAGTNDQILKSSISKLKEESRQLNVASAKVAASLRSTIASNAPMVEKALSAVGEGTSWGVVLGSDVSLEAARDEIGRASKNAIPGAAIYLRNGYYVSIAVTNSREIAQHYLTIARGFRPDAYIVSMGTWCRNPQQRDGFMECQDQ